MRARKKPVEVEVMQLLNSNYDIVANWCNGLLVKRSDNFEPSIQIFTLEGMMTARLNDYIIKGVRGEFYPVAQSIFEHTYEVINE
jgi:hypothetical protein